jgi:hypothetical protein
MLKHLSAVGLSLAILLTAHSAQAKGHGHSKSAKKSSGAESSSTERVKGYTKKNGTYVAPHDKTTPDHDKTNNWSTKGNVNPETGKPGTVDPNKQ